LTRLADFAHRWSSSHQLPAQLKGLSEYISGWQIHPSILKDYELLGLRPVEREVIDRVKRQCGEDITALLQKLPNTPPPAATFTALWGEQGEQQVRLALKELNMLHPPAAKGKGRYVAVMHAAYDHFGKPIRHLKDWSVMMTDFFQGNWGEDIKPHKLNEAPDWYKAAYDDMMLQLKQQPRF